MTTSEIANWVQAVGSLIAIAGSIYAVDRQHRKAMSADRLREDTLTRDRMNRLQATIRQAHSHVHWLTDNDPGPLAGHWRKHFNNDVSLALANVEFILEQLRAVSVFDVPVGPNVVKSLNEAASGLIAARLALSRENLSTPFSVETPDRVSRAIPLAARESAGMAVLRGNAIIEAQNGGAQGDA